MNEAKKKGKPLEGYVEVAERIPKFYEKYPEGSLQGRYWMETIGEQVFIVYRAEAFRTPDDKRPGIGMAWEPFPGKTPFTRDSELMVGETSAWGRALAGLGFEVHRGIASANEIRNREGAGGGGEATGPQKSAITRRCNELAIADEEKVILFKWAGAEEELTKRSASKLIGLLKDSKDWGDVWDRAGIPRPDVADDLPVAAEPEPPFPTDEEKLL